MGGPGRVRVWFMKVRTLVKPKIPRTHWGEDFFRDSRVIKAPNVTWEKVREIDLYNRWELRYAHLDTRKVTAILELS